MASITTPINKVFQQGCHENGFQVHVANRSSDDASVLHSSHLILTQGYASEFNKTCDTESREQWTPAGESHFL